MDAILNFIILVTAAIIACMGLYMLFIWIFRKPKEGEKNSDAIKKFELIFGIFLIVMGVGIYLLREDLAVFLTTL